MRTRDALSQAALGHRGAPPLSVPPDRLPRLRHDPGILRCPPSAAGRSSRPRPLSMVRRQAVSWRPSRWQRPALPGGAAEPGDARGAGGGFAGSALLSPRKSFDLPGEEKRGGGRSLSPSRCRPARSRELLSAEARGRPSHGVVAGRAGLGARPVPGAGGGQPVLAHRTDLQLHQGHPVGGRGGSGR